MLRLIKWCSVPNNEVGNYNLQTWNKSLPRIFIKISATFIANTFLFHLHNCLFRLVPYEMNCHVQDPKFWTYRPLTELMVRAAADDVRFLPYIYHNMMKKLNERSLWYLGVRGALYCRCFCINDNDYADWPSLPPIPGFFFLELLYCCKLYFSCLYIVWNCFFFFFFVYCTKLFFLVCILFLGYENFNSMGFVCPPYCVNFPLNGHVEFLPNCWR